MKLRDLIGMTPQETLWDGPEMTRARKRVSRMSTHELLDWADGAGSGMARAFSDFRKEGSILSLTEIRTGIIALSAVIEQLEARHEEEK